MRRLYSKYDIKCYMLLKAVLYDLELTDKPYWWLISDFEAVPREKDYQNMLEHADYLLLSTREVVEMLENDDFQWIWAVFSAISTKYSKEEILQFELPYIMDFEEGKYNPYTDEPKVQHPYADFEIYACDSSYMFMITDDADLISKFQKSYPLYEEK